MRAGSNEIQMAGAGAPWGRGRACAVRSNSVAPGRAARRSQLFPFALPTSLAGATASGHVSPAWPLAPTFSVKLVANDRAPHGSVKQGAAVVSFGFGLDGLKRPRNRKSPRPLRLLPLVHCPMPSAGDRLPDERNMIQRAATVAFQRNPEMNRHAR